MAIEHIAAAGESVYVDPADARGPWTIKAPPTPLVNGAWFRIIPRTNSEVNITLDGNGKNILRADLNNSLSSVLMSLDSHSVRFEYNAVLDQWAPTDGFSNIGIFAGGAPASGLRPHWQHPSSFLNMAYDPIVSSGTGWTYETGASFDPAVTHTGDGSGSHKITTPGTFGVRTPQIDFTGQPDGWYIISFWVYSDTYPNLYGCQAKAYTAGGSFITNITLDRYCNMSAAGIWEEFSTMFWLEKASAPKYNFEVYKRDSPLDVGQIWVDDFKIYAAVPYSSPILPVHPPYEDPPTLKVGWEPAGTPKTKIDDLGNWQSWNGASYDNWFPCMMHTDGNRPNKAEYVTEGWDINIWASSNARVQQYRDVGMESFFKIGDYCNDGTDVSPPNPSPLYGDIAHLEQQLIDIQAAGNLPWVKGYYWDNENGHYAWQVPIDVVAKIREYDTEAPIYILQGNPTARGMDSTSPIGGNVCAAYYAGEVNDVTVEWDNARYRQILWEMEHRKNTPNMDNTVGVNISAQRDHIGEMRLAIYNCCWIGGARFIAYYGDVGSEPDFLTLPWRDDFRLNLKNEIETQWDIFRAPEWTDDWGATSDTANVRVSTRELGARKFVIAVNQTDQVQAFNVTLTGNHGSGDGDDVQDVHTSAVLANVSGGAFGFAIAGLGEGSGTHVMEILV